MSAALKLIEGTKADRDKYIKKVEVLDKVKELVLLPDGEHMTTHMVADFYEVELKTVQMAMLRHKEEFESDGVEVIKKDKLKMYKETYLPSLDYVKYARQLSLLPKRAVLRVGMILTQSPVADKIRDYLLNIEENSSKKEKNEALRRNGWTREEDQKLLSYIRQSLSEGKTISYGIRKFANESTKRTESAVGFRYNSKLSHLIDKDELKNNVIEIKEKTVEVEDSNKETVEVNASKQTNKLEDMLSSFENKVMNALNQQNKRIDNIESQLHKVYGKLTAVDEDLQDNIAYHNQIVDENNLHNDEKVKVLQGKNEKLAHKLKKVQGEYNEILKHIGRSARVTYVDEKINETGQAFKMDRNGNLQKV